MAADKSGGLMSRSVLSWAFYDWANSAFATTVMAGFFPAFLKSYWSAEAPATTTTLRLGAANSVASLLIVFLAPVLGAIADRGSSRKRFLIFFAFLGVLSSAALYWVSQGGWLVALILYGAGVVGFSGANIFYDSLLLLISPKGKVDTVSGMGYAFGYVGGGLLFLLNVLMVTFPAGFGLSGPEEAVRLSFISVAIWWAIFSIPIILFVKEPASTRTVIGFGAVKAGFRQLSRTFQEIRKLRMVFLFLVGYWLYIDGVDTIVRMAVDYGLSLGFQQQDLLTALLITQAVGFPSALLFGKIGETLGPKTGIFICIGIYLGVTVWAVFIQTVAHFYTMACAVGFVQGGIQALSRSYYSRLIPADQTAEFYGFFNMLGKFAAVVGPPMMGFVGVATGSPRLSILSLIILFIAGGVLLYFVDEEKGKQIAKSLERSQPEAANGH